MISLEKGLALVRAHAQAELDGDMDAVLATLEPDPLYELFPIGRAFRGMAAAKTYYDYFFAHFPAMARGSTMHSEWTSEQGVAREYSITVCHPETGDDETYRVIAIFTFGPTLLAGERLYSSERFLRLLFGPGFALAQPIS